MNKSLFLTGRIFFLLAVSLIVPLLFAELLSTGTDVMVNDPSGESGPAQTQSETTIAINENTGTICAAYNDFYYIFDGQGGTGFSRSVDGGASFTDGGPFGSHSLGDPSLYWRKADGNFYFASIDFDFIPPDINGVGLWLSTDDCQTFQFQSLIHSGFDDKELIAIDNNLATSPYYGRIYAAWTNLGAGRRLYSSYSDDGITWSSPLTLNNGDLAYGAWPVVAPNGDVYIGWSRDTGNFYHIDIVRSTDGGISFNPITSPMSGEVYPRDSAATANCTQTALNGNIRHIAFPQLAVSPNGDLHAVYSYDPDGIDNGDVVDVFYRRSTDNGATWDPEVRLNDDSTQNDQFSPTISAGSSGRIVATWYDRRWDTENYLLDYYMAVSEDGGSTWSANVRVSDVTSLIYIDPYFADCYHGDYDMQTQDADYAYLLWSDDRRFDSGHYDPDVYFDKEDFQPGFTIDGAPTSQAICAPADAQYTVHVGSFLSYTNPVNLSASGTPPGTSVIFSSDPVNPPGTSLLTIGNTASGTPGNYSITIGGNSITNTHSDIVALELFTAIPAAPALLTPADGAMDAARAPEFSWTGATQAGQYNLEVATDIGFTNIVYTVTVEGESHTPETLLDPFTTYYWHVVADNVCGSGPASATYSFTTVPSPILLVDDDDNFPDIRFIYTEALDGLGLTYDIWDTNNRDNELGISELTLHEMVVWFTGDSTNIVGPGVSSETALGNWLNTGGCLFISSQDYYTYRGLTPFMSNYLGVQSAVSDVGHLQVTGQGSVFGGSGPYNLFPPHAPFYFLSDVINPDSTAEVAFLGDQGNAAVNKDGGVYRTTFWGFPFETIEDEADREDVMEAVVNWCSDLPRFTYLPAVLK